MDRDHRKEQRQLEKKLGLSMTIIVSTVTGVVLYFQVYSKGG